MIYDIIRLEVGKEDRHKALNGGYMGKIFCLMGKSSSGKDTIFKLLKKDGKLNLKPIIPYTTRPIRNNETNGVEYFFIDKQKLYDFEKSGKIVEKREYNTVKGIWFYATIDDGRINLKEDNYILISTLEAYEHIRKYFGSNNVFPIYITVDDSTRLERALKREKKEQNPNYNEVCRRFLADNKDFSEEKLVQNEILRYYINNDLEECLEQVRNDILKSINN